MKIYLDEKIIEENQVSLFEPWLFYGYGLFETIKIFQGKTIFLNEHYQRMKKSSMILDLKINIALSKIIEITDELIKINKIQEGSLKFLLLKGLKYDHLLINTNFKKYDPEKYNQGLSIKISERRKNEKSLIINHKSTNYLENILEKEAALKEGYADALFLNSKECLTETTVANIFFINKKEIYTPSVDAGILPGVVREKVFYIAKQKNIVLKEGYFSKEKIMSSEAVFITNSLMGIMPIKLIDNQKFNINNEIMSEISKFYNYLMEG
ncbi:MAG: aminotransferase class IV [Endomicrobiaceae bacterium]|nr:aminotransferase class IV [Endomicrobiaceae bacterium]